LRKKKEILKLISCYARSWAANVEVRNGGIAKPGKLGDLDREFANCGLGVASFRPMACERGRSCRDKRDAKRVSSTAKREELGCALEVDGEGLETQF